MNLTRNPLVDHFRCPESLGPVQLDRNDAPTATVAQVNGNGDYGPTLPLDPAQLIDDLRLERYPLAAESKAALSKPQAIRSLYYALRPLMPVAIRKWAQRTYLSRWQSLQFPKWPVDCTVEEILEKLMVRTIEAQGLDKVPFLWFWPNGKKSCVLVTHDVETRSGRDFTSKLMDLDDQHGIKSSFQVIPNGGYEVTAACLAEIRGRGFEINVHDLKHDGSLFCNHDGFLRQVRQINEYGKQWGVSGFRAGVMYRVQEWFDALDFQYDMSVPNVATLEPQRGGCCTVFPYFNGDLLEIPLTTTQDYTLFHILGDYSTGIWQRQIELIGRINGLISFIVHPDYVIEDRARRSYVALLGLLAGLKDRYELWIATPGELNSWWRARDQTNLVKRGAEWSIEGPAGRQARLAYASVDRDHLVFEV